MNEPTKTTGMWICWNCSKENPCRNNFCVQCGANNRESDEAGRMGEVSNV